MEDIRNLIIILHVRRRVIVDAGFSDAGMGMPVGVGVVSPCNKCTMDGSDLAP